MNDIKTSAICKYYFHETEVPRKWKCKICASKTLTKGNGWSNLMTHITACHEDYKTIMSVCSQSGVDIRAFLKGERENALNGWISLIVDRGLPFSAVNKQELRSISRLKPISYKTLMKNVMRLTAFVMEDIRINLPDKFGIIFDGWTNNRKHFIAIFSEYSFDGKPVRDLLAVKQLPDQTNQNAANHAALIRQVMEECGRTERSILYVVADNTNLNPATARILRTPCIGCASHRLNCAVRYLLDHNYVGELGKVNNMMRHILDSSPRNGKLAQWTSLKAIGRNATRWSSQYQQLARFAQLKPIFDAHAIELEFYPQHILTAAESLRLEHLLIDMKKINDVTIQLQSDHMTILGARDLFDALVEEYGDVLGPQIQADSDLVTSPDFESAIQKLQAGEILDEYEETSAQVFRKPDTPPAPATAHVNFAIGVLREAKRRRTERGGALYHDTAYVSPTSNIVERLFSRAKLNWSAIRASMSPANLENLLLLQANRSRWNLQSFYKIVVEDDEDSDDPDDEYDEDDEDIEDNEDVNDEN